MTISSLHAFAVDREAIEQEFEGAMGDRLNKAFG